MADKQATIFVLDLANSMGKVDIANEFNKSDLDFALEYVFDKIGTKIIGARKTDFVGVIGVSTPETDNVMANELDYAHISTLLPLKQVLLPDFRMLQQRLLPSKPGNEGDLVSALLIALFLIEQHCQKLKYIKQITLLSNCEYATNFLEMDQIVKRIADLEVSVVIMTLGDEITSDVKRDNLQKLSDFAAKAREYGAQIECVSYAREVLIEMDIPTVRTIRPTASFRGLLSIGDPFEELYQDGLIQIPVERYACIKLAKAPNTTAYKSDTNSQIGRKIVYKVELDSDEDPNGDGKIEIEVEKDKLTKGFRYGNTVIPFDNDELELLRFPTRPGIDIIGFVALAGVKPWILMSETAYIVASSKSEEAQIALSSFIRAMREQGLAAIARYVSKVDNPPVMVLLFPDPEILDTERDILLEVEVPFAEDVRSYKFPSLSLIKTTHGKILTQHHHLPTTDMVANMRAFVNAMDISSLTESGLPSDQPNNGREFAAPGQLFDPINAAINRAIIQRGLNPDSSIDNVISVEPGKEYSLAPLLRQTRPPKKLVDLASDLADHLVDSLNVQKVSKYATNKRKFRQAGIEELQSSARTDKHDLKMLLNSGNKRLKLDRIDQAKELDQADKIDLDTFDLKSEIRRWGQRSLSSDPDTLDKVFDRAAAHIEQLLDQIDSPPLPEHESAVHDQLRIELQALQGQSKELDEESWWNSFYIRLSDRLQMSGSLGISVLDKIKKDLQIPD
ncbi:SPOC like C-terminal domain-containing protein [Lipomyces oligophaga]|uniref:SPOC like C-terminal domain-containing protein n=1 Tax=Lipomyces oligophaga TaxID=45792 RepID=UPI0034CD1AF5